MRSRRMSGLLAAVVLAAAPLAGCSADDGGEAGSASDSPSVAASEDFNSADVTFASDMIPHHAQALVMSDMASKRTISPELKRLVQQIQAAQTPEIEQMSGWLTDWGQEIPETSRDHMHAEGHGGHDMGDMGDMGDMDDMPGMMSEGEMSDLDDARGSDFERMWLEMMIEHHEGAIEMSQTEVDDGEFPEATSLAQSIIESQQAEIDQMESMLEG